MQMARREKAVKERGGGCVDGGGMDWLCKKLLLHVTLVWRCFCCLGSGQHGGEQESGAANRKSIGPQSTAVPLHDTPRIAISPPICSLRLRFDSLPSSCASCPFPPASSSSPFSVCYSPRTASALAHALPLLLDARV